MDGEQVVYRTVVHMAEAQGKEGGLFFGYSIVYPGLVGQEYFMTKGHFHAQRGRAEYYWCIRGKGILLLMDEKRQCRAEKMLPGSLHYIPGNIAHRIVNTGDGLLIVGACWPTDAGHDYASIEIDGFPLRIMQVKGNLALMES